MTKHTRIAALISAVSATMLLVTSCATVPKSVSPLPRSSEVTCVEPMNLDYKYLAWGLGEDNPAAEEDAVKAAVYTAMTSRGAGGCAPVMSTSEAMKNGEFIQTFFADGKWRQFATNTNRGRIDPNKRLKLEDGTIKLGIDVVVNVSGLRQYLTELGVIQSMRIGN